MHITGLGIALLPLGAVLFFLSPRTVYYAAIFFVPFTATSLLNMSSGVPLTPGQYFGALFILHEILNILLKGSLIPLWQKNKAVIPLLGFLAATLISVVLPHMMDGGVRFVSGGSSTDLMLYYSSLSQSLKGTLPVLFGIIFLLFVIRRNLTEAALKKTVQVYLISAVFVCLWGYLEFACNNILHIEYPAFIFNNAVLETMQGYKQIVLIGDTPFTRVTSVTHEPSILAKFLITIVPILLVSVLLKTPLLGRRWDRFALGIVVGVLLLSTAATAYVGLVIILVFATVGLLLLAKRFRPHHLLMKLIVVPGTLLGLLLWLLPIAQTMVYWFVFEKLSSGSAMQRSSSVLEAWPVFERFPIFGAGYGMVTSNDLIVYLLSNVGIVGFVSFSVAIGIVVAGYFRSVRWFRNMPGFRSREMLGLVSALTISLLSLLAVSIITGIELYLEYFYLVLALVIAANIIVRREMEYSRQLHQVRGTALV